MTLAIELGKAPQPAQPTNSPPGRVARALPFHVREWPRAAGQSVGRLGGVPLEFPVALNRDQDSTHLVALSEDDLLDLAVVERI